MDINRINSKSTDSTEDIGEAKSGEEGEEYNPSRPNVLEILQSSVPPGFTLQQHGQSEVITGPDGRRFIAQLYEQAPAESATQSDPSQSDDTGSSSSESATDTDEENPEASQNPNNSQDDGDMARTLCVNLLSELVKGSYQLFKTRGPHLQEPAKKEAMNKLTLIQKKCDDVKESLSGNAASESESSSSRAEESLDGCAESQTSSNLVNAIGDCNDLKNLADNDCNDLKNLADNSNAERKLDNSIGNEEDLKKDTVGSSDEIVTHDESPRKRRIDDAVVGCGSPTNFKKAKYSWQIKGNNTPQKESSENTNPSSVAEVESSQEKEVKTDEPIKNVTDNNIHDCKLDCSNGNTSEAQKSSDNIENKKDCGTVPTASGNSSEDKGDDSQGSSNLNTQTRSANGQAPFTYLERWQNHHIAKAIVDNAINKTLDEMNLGPQDGQGQAQTGSSFSRQRQRIEDAGVSQVILQRGLRRQTRPTPRSNTTGTINPFINHLTEMTENMFVENLSQGLRFSARIDMTGNIEFNTRSIHESENLMSQNISATGNNTSTVTRQISAAAISLNQRPSDSVTLDQINEIPESSNSATETEARSLGSGYVRNIRSGSLFDNLVCSENPSSVCTTSQRTESVETIEEQAKSTGSSTSHEYMHPSSSIVDNEENPSDDNIETTSYKAMTSSEEQDLDNEILKNSGRSALDVIEEIEKSAPSQNFLLDTAVNAVIYEKGLQF